VDIPGILKVSGLILYGINYVTGVGLKFGFIKISRRPHQVIYSLLIINIILLLLYLGPGAEKFYLYFFSLAFLLALPFGRKGGAYHIIVGTLGFLTWLFSYL
jgi:hypothetical protein